jgi:cold shock protein
MPTGKVKFYREDKGYGLIAPDDGGKAVFVHITSVADPSVEVFREDRRVRYVERISQRSGNPEAFDVVCCDVPLSREYLRWLKQRKAIIAY